MHVLSRELGVAPKYLVRLADDTADRIDGAMIRAAEEVRACIDAGEQALVERLVQRIRHNVKQMRKHAQTDRRS